MTICGEMYRRRVVVTGLGALSCIGTGMQATWNGVLSGKSFLEQLSGPEWETVPCKVAGFVKGCDLKSKFSDSQFRSLSRGSMFALLAAEEALNDSQLNLTAEARLRTGVAVGMSMPVLDEICSAGKLLDNGSYRRISPYFIPKIITNMPAGVISMTHGLKGPNHSVATACTTGLHAVGDAFRFIERGDADVMVCGGTEASVTPLALAGFCRMRALSTSFNDKPQQASRPFDKDRDGFVMSEGAAIVILEDYERAKSRGARIYAEILGYGLSGDAHHFSAPDPDGDGALRAMTAAVEDARISSNLITHVNAHATSTPLGDHAEAKAIEKLFGEHSHNVMVTSTKGTTGHMIGAAGSMEFALSALACYHSQVPGIANLENTEISTALKLIRQTKDAWNIEDRFALTNSFGFGGTNASICLRNFSL